MTRQIAVSRDFDGTRFIRWESEEGVIAVVSGDGTEPRFRYCGACELEAVSGSDFCAFHDQLLDDAPIARGPLTHLRGRRDVAPLTSLLRAEDAKDQRGWQVRRIVGPDPKREARQRALLDSMVNGGLSFAAAARRHGVTINTAKAVLWKFAPRVAQQRQVARRTVSPEKRERRRQLRNASQNRRNQARRAENVARTTAWRARNREAYRAYMREYQRKRRKGVV